MHENRQVFTLKQVASSIRKTIETRYGKMYWVKAEMHKLNLASSGHCFPELVQKEEGRIVAEMRGNIWKSQYQRINKRFIEVVKEPLKDDTTLLLQVKISFHETYGMSLQIMDIDPQYSLGELQKERQETLRRLQKEGLLNANQNLNFPLLPKRIAVISAEATKGLSDFLSVVAENSWGYSFFTMLFPAYLQGDNASSSIIAQLERIKRVQDHFDIVVLVRGGGGEVGLSCYNDYELCKAIAQFPLPVLTGIGHSTNLTVAEMISFRNTITPTELGEFLIQSFHNFSVPLKDAIKSIKHHVAATMHNERTLLENNSKIFKNVVKQAVLRGNEVLRLCRSELRASFKFSLQFSRDALSRLEQKVYQNSKLSLVHHSKSVDKIAQDLPLTAQTIFIKENAKLEQLKQSIRLMDPMNILKRGYSITTLNGKTLGPENPVKKGDVIRTKTSTFTIESEVTIKNER